ncbi:DUF3126 family protein [Azospirillum cavernae]|uniref:DUF3126 family protein n=1 Tax=Azospirillum cavernae TaxID=2320860 RepID=UPI001EE5AE8D|nr:DUF3126 family protein [Azospirillum cavernae]
MPPAKPTVAKMTDTEVARVQAYLRKTLRQAPNRDRAAGQGRVSRSEGLHRRPSSSARLHRDVDEGEVSYDLAPVDRWKKTCRKLPTIPRR